MIFVILLLFGAGFFVFLALDDSGSAQFSSKSPKAISSKANDLSNTHLFLTSKRIELEQERRRLENMKLAGSPATEIVEPNSYPENYGVNHTGDRNETTAYDDLRRYEPEVQATSPSYEVQTSLFEKQKMAEYSEDYKQEYARQFVANARAAGYHVQLSKDFVVMSVTRIQNGDRQMRVIQSINEPVLMKQPSIGQSRRPIAN